MTDTKAATAAPAATISDPKYKVGDTVVIPCHNGTYTAVVVKVYKNLEEARNLYEKSFNAILQSPHGKGDANQPFYFCQVANRSLTPPHPLGVAEEHATLKRRA